MLKYRLLTAGVLIPLTLGAIFTLPEIYLAVLLGVIVLFAAWEWTLLAGCSSVLARSLYLLMIVAGMIALYPFLPTPLWIVIIACIWWFTALLWVWDYEHGATWLPQIWIRHILGFVLLLPTWFSLLALNAEKGAQWVVLLLFLIWFADSAAYFAGRRWGRHKLAGRVSPGKTWEGVLAGMAAGLAVGLVFALWQAMNGWTLVEFGILCVFTLIASVLGDLFESLFKRLTGIKDSGWILPGHGGVFDRIDSLTAAAPVFLCGVLLMGIGA